MTESQLLKGSETPKHFLIKMLSYYLLKKKGDFDEVTVEKEYCGYTVDVYAMQYNRETCDVVIEVSQNTVQKDRQKLKDISFRSDYFVEDHLIKAKKYPSNIEEIKDRLIKELGL